MAFPAFFADIPPITLRDRAHVRERFSVERMCAATLSVYESLLEPAQEAGLWAAPTG